MPLPPGVSSRKRIHTRSIETEGWKREDGCWDIEARLTDVKDHDFDLASCVIPQGNPIHDMWVRLTIDRDFVIRAVTAVTDVVPHPGDCEKIAPDYAKLVGLNLLHGFRKRAEELFEGVRGCVHLTALLQVMPAVALQTYASEVSDAEIQNSPTKPGHLDGCYGLRTDSETVRLSYPRWYKGQSSD